MNNTDYTILQILQGMQETLFALQKGQEELQIRQDALKKDMNGQESPEPAIVHNNLSGAIPRPVPNIKDITLVHIYRMMSHNLGVELDKGNKAILHSCTGFVCDELATLPSVQALGQYPNWSTISQENKNWACTRHACLLRSNGIDFTRCHKNWASVAKVSQLWKNRKK
ncbi:hypothetical protein PHYBLDRAFT_70059 [Phycomyces blakesleeanus NRRL 1555(-)]|uniref:Uncharacterized protein n=1 Tax=Phycomyces blakesleeanus (strain ATCC 8743b / DSM 1359 / FGSC 10004 / NBRC 33097 / NRRL 1555) TaxID=763407 RepID=A0A167M2X0_PHYB8|nr:hypothetical protein PHYBLDRAFT_70059 [Phycomyces blakesleeanus NRRL 1555(-)]OAD71609.1 hypothetical protein PHYBLDRAFT_70059 [Phycomyces blakesleeanus NRRL 1555(-)]|eukprot:XP_018289649.1 hypothetical protein PHYBLDRAFT_70059 [Phycomyces blakesleeanus NRRL 1555(-)]